MSKKKKTKKRTGLPQKRNKNLPAKTSSNRRLETIADQITDPGNGKELLQVTQTVSHHQGPYPSPGQFKEYQEIDPEIVVKILAHSEKEQDHRHTMDRRGQSYDFTQKLVGQFFGFMIGMGALGYGAHVATSGNPWSGALLGTGGVASLVAVFVYGKKKD
jgi:uncharacterized membrane protein